MADFRDSSDMADGEEKGVKVEVEVSSLRGWMGLGADFGCVHRCGNMMSSASVFRGVGETPLDTKNQGSNQAVLKCLIYVRYCKSCEHYE